MNPEEFQAEFKSRIAAYLADKVETIDVRPVVVDIGQDAQCPVGHALAYGLTNLLARAHRQVAFAGDLDRELLCPGMFEEKTVRDATVELCKAINPHIEVLEGQDVPDPLIVVGVGADPGAVDLAVGCDGWCATFHENAGIVESEASMWGACLAACYAAATCFHAMLGKHGAPQPSQSLWEYGAVGTAQGPDARPVNVGRVLQVGAGAVGSAFDFWLQLIGIEGRWVIADQDVVDASNLSRQLGFIAADAGYPSGEPQNKAVALASRLTAATPSPFWYGSDSEVTDRQYDLVLALANEHAARQRLQERQPPVLLHATTSIGWESQVHRHIAGRDDCINCRIPGDTPRLRCTTGFLDEEKEVDASLPFLSGTAGLLLASELVRLTQPTYPTAGENYASIYMGEPGPIGPQRIQHTCVDDCAGWLDLDQVKRINQGTRFVSVIQDER